MRKVAIVTDSVACLTTEQAQEYDIQVVPAARILFEGKVYKDWVDITPSQAFEMLDRSPDGFCTSAISPVDFCEAYKEAMTQTDTVLCITLSSKLSAVYHVANLAKEEVERELPGSSIEVLDSENVAACQGFIAIAAAKAAAGGSDLTQTIEAATWVKERVKLAGLIDTVRYVYRTGRVPKLAAWMGSALNIKPVFTISQGSVHPVGVTRSRTRGVERALNMMRENVGRNQVHVSVIHTGALDQADELMSRISSEFNCVELWPSQFSPVMAYATGPGVLGLAFYAEK